MPNDLTTELSLFLDNFIQPGGMILAGYGSPEGVMAGMVGWLYTQLDGTGTLYEKTTGTGTTGWSAIGAGGVGTPANPASSVQFNDVGVFGGDATLLFNKTTNVLTAERIGVTGGAGGTDILAVTQPDHNTYAQTWTNTTAGQLMGYFMSNAGVAEFDTPAGLIFANAAGAVQVASPAIDFFGTGAPDTAMTVNGQLFQTWALTPGAGASTTNALSVQVTVDPTANIALGVTPHFTAIKGEVITGQNKTISSLIGVEQSVANGSTSTTDEAYGGNFTTQNVSTGTINRAYGAASLIDNLSTGTIAEAWGFRSLMSNGGGGTVTKAYSFYGNDLHGVATQPYYFWADSQGVFRIREDSVADTSSFPQAVTALYNPRFTKYTPGATNFERIVQQWVGNVAQIGTEAGGTGTLRNLQFLGPIILAPTFRPTTGYQAVDTSPGISTTITSAGLVGKTITVKDGLITGFA